MYLLLTKVELTIKVPFTHDGYYEQLPKDKRFIKDLNPKSAGLSSTADNVQSATLISSPLSSRGGSLFANTPHSTDELLTA